jgi:hypothetical protein
MGNAITQEFDESVPLRRGLTDLMFNCLDGARVFHGSHRLKADVQIAHVAL